MAAVFKLHLLYLLSFVSDCKRCLLARTSSSITHFPSELAVTPPSALPHLGGTSLSADITSTWPILCSLKPHRHCLKQPPVLPVALLRLQLFFPSISSPLLCFFPRHYYVVMFCTPAALLLLVVCTEWRHALHLHVSLLNCWPETLTHNSTVGTPQPTPNSLMWYTFLKSPCSYCEHFKPCLHFVSSSEHSMQQHGESQLVLQMSFVALSQNGEKWPSAAPCLSVYPNGTARHLLDRLSWNLIFEYFLKLCA